MPATKLAPAVPIASAATTSTPASYPFQCSMCLRENRRLRAEIDAAIAEVCDSGRVRARAGVREVRSRRWPAYCGTEHAVGCASGSDALLLALVALGIGPGDEVIVPSFTFFATASAVWRLGARPVFVDIRPDTFNLDPADVLNKLTTATKAIIPGAPVRPVRRDGCDPSDRLGRPRHSDHRRRLPGDRRRVQGTAGRLARHVRLLQLLSDQESGRLRRRRADHDQRRRAGGQAARAARSRQAAAVLSPLRRHQQPARYAAGGRAEREAAELDEWAAARERHATATPRNSPSAGSTNQIVVPTVADDCHHVWNQYTIRVTDGRRDELQKHLAERKIGSAIYYPVPLHLQKCFAALGYEAGQPAGDRAGCREVLSLPVYPELTAAEQGAVIEAVASFCQGKARSAA